MLKGLIILLFTFTCIVAKDLTRYDKNTCYDKTAGDYRCCSDYEEINGECIKCTLGFISRKGNPCEPCGINLFGEGCLQTCLCNELQRCDNVKGCVEIYIASTSSTLTTQSNIAKAITSEDSVTIMQEEEHTNGLSKTELLILLCGALSGIIVLLGIFGMSSCIKKRLHISKSKLVKTIEEGVDNVEENSKQEIFELHESLYETIDDGHLDRILLPQTCSTNLEKDDDSSSSESISNCNEDRPIYLHPFVSPITNETRDRREEQRQKVIPFAKKSNCNLDQSSCSRYPPIEEDVSGYEISVDCTYDRASYFHRNDTRVENSSYCHISDIDKSEPLSQ